jgi:thiamine-monophosphate kinase
LRSGARPGDRIYVTGELGGGAAALKEFFAGRKAQPKEFQRHFHPVPRIVIGDFLRKRGLATAMIDLSDGLSTDLIHICEESGVGAEILVAEIPRACVGHPRKAVDLKLALHGGEDYELLFTARPITRIPNRIAGVPVSFVGTITRARDIQVRNQNGSPTKLKPEGWEHFK